MGWILWVCELSYSEKSGGDLRSDDVKIRTGGNWLHIAVNHENYVP